MQQKGQRNFQSSAILSSCSAGGFGRPGGLQQIFMTKMILPMKPQFFHILFFDSDNDKFVTGV